MFVVLVVHGDKDVGVDDVCVADGFEDVVGDGHVAELHTTFDDVLMGAVAVGACERNIHIDFRAAEDEGVGDVVSVSDVSEFEVIQPAFDLPYGIEVREDLQGMRGIGEAVDHGNGSVFGKFFDAVIVKAAQDDGGDAVAFEHDGGIADTFAAGELGFVLGR